MKDENCCDDTKPARVLTLELDAKGNVVRDAKGIAKWIQEGSSETESTSSELESNDRAVVTVECRTTPTTTSGRKSCNDEEVHRLPTEYVFAENEAVTTWHSDIGSSNHVDVSFHDRAEVFPGSGFKLAQTMRVKAHARSGHGMGERGHTSATVSCRFFRRIT